MYCILDHILLSVFCLTCQSKDSVVNQFYLDLLRQLFEHCLFEFNTLWLIIWHNGPLWQSRQSLSSVKLSTVRIMSVDVIYINSLSIFYSKERGCLDFECTSGQIVYLQQCMLFLIREFRWIRKSSVKLGRRSVRWGRFTAGSSKTFNPSSLERRWAHQLCELILSCLQ